jgi:regulator of RNase E activity RraA
VIIVPKQVTLEVLEKTEKMVNTENTARQEYKEGDPEEVYMKYKRL